MFPRVTITTIHPDGATETKVVPTARHTSTRSLRTQLATMLEFLCAFEGDEVRVSSPEENMYLLVFTPGMGETTTVEIRYQED